MAVTPIIAIIGSIGVYFALPASKTDKDKELSITTDLVKNPTVDISTQSQGANSLGIQVFPKLNQANYYKYIKLKNGIPYIPDDLLAHIVNDVLQKMQYTDGVVSWRINYIDSLSQNDVHITFQLKPTGNGILKDEIKKTYAQFQL